MSAAPSPVFEETPQRVFPRHPINVPLDLIALRSGVPENLPGRCTDLSEAGVGAVVLFACLLVLTGLGWWQWQRSWNELEKRAPVGESGLRVSPETMEKRIVTKLEPVYPEAARKAGMQGLVVLDAVIAPDGNVKRLRPVSGPDLLVQSATEAVQSWKFEPYLSSGKAVEVETTIAVEFRLN